MLRRLRPPQRPIRLAVVGLPGSGKTTQARWLSIEFGIPCVSLREEVAALAKTDSLLGDALRVHISAPVWQPLPDELALVVVTESIVDLDSWILEGFPRNREQAIAVLERLATVVHLDISAELSMQRMVGRARDPEDPATVSQRQDVERGRFADLLAYCREEFRVIEVDGSLQEDVVTKTILDALCGGRR